MQQTNITKNLSPYEQLLQKKIKRKYMRSEAERACAKEAAASRQALEALQKELAIQPQVNSFVIEDSCTETTVENFIPHTDERFVENVRDFQGLPVVNYYSVNGTGFGNRGQPGNIDKSLTANPLLQFNIRNDGNTQTEIAPQNKMKSVLDGDITHNVEIMFKTSEGDFVSVTDELLQNISKSALQYQVIDENGFAGEMQELRVLNKVLLDPSEMSHKFIYDQDGLNASSIIDAALNDIPKADKDATVAVEETKQNKIIDTEVPSVPCETLKDIQIPGHDKPDIESCLDMLIPEQSSNTTISDLDPEKETFVHSDVATTENLIADFSLGVLDHCEENSNILDCQTVLDSVNKNDHSDTEMCSAEKRQKLMCINDDESLDMDLLNQCEGTAATEIKFSPRRTRSTGKCQSRSSILSEGDIDIENLKNDKTRTRKSINK